AIDFVDVVDQANGVILRWFKNHGACAVAEDDTGCAVGVVDDRGHDVGADHQDFLVHSAGDVLSTGLQGIEKRRTGGGEIESPGSLGTQLVLHQAGGRGEEHVGRNGGDKNSFDVDRVDTALGQSTFCGFGRQVTGGYAFVRQMAFA